MLHVVAMSPMSTEQVAKAVTVNRVTLERWLSSGKFKGPKVVNIGRGTFRQWTQADVDRIQKYKQENYRKGRGRKPKS
jgi:predicted site-specific integrase-resolvase